MEELAIRIEHVSKIYKLYDKPSDRLKEALGLGKKVQSKEHYALNDVSFDVKKGETVGIIGTNGSGKSTILKIITGVLNQTSGDVKIDGRISALLELGAGFNMEYNGIENVYLNGTMIGFSKEEIDAKLDDILAFADIGDYVYQPVKTYSSGMFVRLAFAVAINIDPEILIVDEALSVGDVFFQAKCYKKFEEFKKQGKTILFVSHDLGSISKYCDRVILLNQGVKLKEGSPREMVDLFKKVLVNQVDESDLMDAQQSEQEGKAQEASNAQNDEAGKPKEENVSQHPQTAGDGTWMSQLTLNPQIQEYGEKIAVLSDFAILDKHGNITNLVEKGEQFQIRIKVEIKEPVEDPIVAFTIKNLQGTDITGTNTMYERADLGVLKPGDTRIVTFTQKADLQGGEYLISLGCTGYVAGAFHVFHRLYDVCNMTVVSDKNTVGFYDMNSEVVVECVK